MREMREQAIERGLKRRIEMKGGRALKFVSPGCRGVPDRLLLLPGGRVCFVEVKAPGKSPTPLQRQRIDELAVLGFHTYVVSSESEVVRLVEELFSNDL